MFERWGGRAGTVALVVLVCALSACVKAGPYGTDHLGNLGRSESPQPSHVELAPVDAAVPIGTTDVLVVTVRDDSGRLVPGARVEWVVVAQSVGGIVAVDDGSGHVRPARTPLRTAASATSTRPYVLDVDGRDVRIGEGQTWCAVASDSIGTCELLAYSPDVPDRLWGEVRVVRDWVDVSWEWPLDAESAPGTPHALTTRVLGATDGEPRAGYPVTYELFDGPPPAAFEVGDDATARRAETTTDDRGVATVTLRQSQPERGWNDVRVTVSSPPGADGTPGRVLATHIVRKTWRGE